MRAMITLIIWTISALIPSNVQVAGSVVIPPMPQYAPGLDFDPVDVDEDFSDESVAEGVFYGGTNDDPWAEVELSAEVEEIEEIMSEEDAEEWDDFWSDSFGEHLAMFNAHFNAIEFKRAKNGASMVRRPGDKSFKFVKRA